jgi:hypothetical protein
MLSNNKISLILESIKQAAKPEKFTHEFLKQLGYNSSNDRAIIPLFKRLGFLTEEGTPTDFYNELKDNTQHAHILGNRIKFLYSELFTINEKINTADDETIKGAISRVTGKDSSTVNRYFSTFKTLVDLAKFDSEKITQQIIKKEEIPKNEKIDKQEKFEKITTDEDRKSKTNLSAPEFHYNIQIHLPATSDISIYNAIFKSLKENILDN